MSIKDMNFDGFDFDAIINNMKNEKIANGYVSNDSDPYENFENETFEDILDTYKEGSLSEIEFVECVAEHKNKEMMFECFDYIKENEKMVWDSLCKDCENKSDRKHFSDLFRFAMDCLDKYLVH